MKGKSLWMVVQCKMKSFVFVFICVCQESSKCVGITGQAIITEHKITSPNIWVDCIEPFSPFFGHCIVGFINMGVVIVTQIQNGLNLYIRATSRLSMVTTNMTITSTRRRNRRRSAAMSFSSPHGTTASYARW